MDDLAHSVRQMQLGSSQSPLRYGLDNIPRFLFRVVSPDSDGSTDETWARSEAAIRRTTHAEQDVLSVTDQHERRNIARTLNEHLWWLKRHNWADDFVSWTSSLLFAIQYVYYRHLKDRRSLEEIMLYVVDTTRFSDGIFIRDSDLIEEFQEDDPSYGDKTLRKLHDLRRGDYYFGEYLSQGSLKIADKCQMISAQALADDSNLFTLQPHFQGTCRIRPGKEKPELANPVLDLREIIFSDKPLKIEVVDDMEDRMASVLSIANRFGHGWKLPMAIYFAALICKRLGREDELVFLEYFRSDIFSAEERETCRPRDVRIIADSMPELERVKEIFRQVYKDYRLQQASKCVGDAETSIRAVYSLSWEEEPDFHLAADSNPTLARIGERLTAKLMDIRDWCQLVSREV